MPWTLALSAAATFVGAVLFIRVGALLRARSFDAEHDQRAMRAFALWWAGIGASTLFLSAMLVAGLAPSPSAGLVAGLRIGSMAALSAALAGLLSHLVYVYTGRDRSVAISLAYSALFAALTGLILWSRPASVDVTGWTVEAVGARPAHPLVIPVVILAYLLPPMVAGGLYLGLLRRAEDATQRRRILVVGVGVLVWTGASLLARASDAALWQLLTRVAIGMVFAVLVARVYAPRSAPHPRGENELLRRVHQLV